jgi:integrase
VAKRERGTGAIISRPGTANLYIRYWSGTRQIQEATGSDNRRVAEQMLQDRLSASRKGATPHQDIKQLRYEDLRAAYIKDDPLRAEKEKYKLAQLDDFFAGKRITHITPDVLRDYIEQRREEDIADPTIRRELVDLRAMFNTARKDGKLGSHPVPHFPMPEDSTSAAVYIEPTQFAKILNGLEAIRHEKMKAEPKAEFEDLRPLFTFLYGTACRLGAALAITFNMVSEDGKEIRVPAHLIKTRQPLDISLTGDFLSPLAEQLKAAKKRAFDKSAPIFRSANYRPEWAKACAKAGVGTWDAKTRTRTGVRIHDCRGSAAANLVDAGIAEGKVMMIAGWKTRAMLDRYVKLTPKGRQRAMEQSGSYLVEQMNGTK